MSASPFRLLPCRFCGSVELEGSACRRCGSPRDAELALDPDVASAAEHLARFDAIVAEIPDDVLYRKGAPPPAIAAKMEAARAEVTALLRIVPPGSALLPGAKDARLRRPTLEREYMRWGMLSKGLSPPPSLEKRALDAHGAWRKGSGGERLELRGAKLVRERYERIDLTKALLEDTDLSRIKVTSSDFGEAEIVRCTFADARVGHTSFAAATITDSDFSRADIDWSGFLRARITRTKLVGVRLARCSFEGVVARHCDFTGAKLREVSFDRARFESCSFRGTDLSRGTTWDQAPTAKGAQFVDCDFTDADFGERDFTNARFVRCKLGALVPNIARSIEGVVVEDCDVDREAFAKRVGPPPMPPPGVRARYRIEAEMSSSDLKARWPISTVVELDHLPSEDEAKKLLDADALSTLAANNGEGCDYSIYYVVIKPG